jgi:putative transposase
LRAGGKDAEEWREKLRRRMGDVSVFMRELKQRFAIWYNHKHRNQGTIWSDRFKSVIVEPSREAMVKVAAYIDLNPVRAELVSDPAEYRFCSYAAALGGEKQVRAGYEMIYLGRGMERGDPVLSYLPVWQRLPEQGNSEEGPWTCECGAG